MICDVGCVQVHSPFIGQYFPQSCGALFDQVVPNDLSFDCAVVIFLHMHGNFQNSSRFTSIHMSHHLHCNINQPLIIGLCLLGVYLPLPQQSQMCNHFMFYPPWTFDVSSWAFLSPSLQNSISKFKCNMQPRSRFFHYTRSRFCIFTFGMYYPQPQIQCIAFKIYHLNK